ncbi:MAG: hypothetical protein GY948_07220 [Alphaproteobacteria bacterium]|nr:hypothetical protein [Alphaproteobacteria bacterium]
MAAAVVPALSYPAVFFLDLALWPLDGAQSLAAPETRLLCAVGVGMLVGWGALLYLLADQVYLHEPALVRKIVLVSICSWFVVDSMGSIAAGAPMNALFNIGLLALFALPVLKTQSPQTQS